MKAEEWREILIKKCEEAGTYRPFFDTVIEVLAQLLERREDAVAKFEATGGNTVVSHTNKAGATNIVKHPALAVIEKMDDQILAYSRELGLTPAGYKRLNAEVVEKPTQGTLEQILAKLEA